jgi:hypothetical protein
MASISMKRQPETIRMEVRNIIWKVLPEIQDYTSSRLMKFEHRKTVQTGDICYLRNDWTTYRAIEVDNFLAGKFNLI